MDPLLTLANRYHLKVIEDACQAHGALYFDEATRIRKQGSVNSGRRAGSMGDVGCFSFYPGKNLGAYGDGGAVVTNNQEIADKIKMLGDHGRLGKKYEHEVAGGNSRLDALQAAVLNVKLKYLDEWNEKRRFCASLYEKLLGDLDSLMLPPNGSFEVKPVYHLYVVRTSLRDKLKVWLEQRGIQCGVHYPLPIHLQPAYRRRFAYGEGDFPKSELASRTVLSLPMYPSLEKIEIEYICQSVHDFFDQV